MKTEIKIELIKRRLASKGKFSAVNHLLVAVSGMKLKVDTKFYCFQI